VDPRDALIVSGLPEDVIGAKFLEIKVAFIKRTGSSPPMKVDYEITSLRELPRIITN
jgi:putative hydrolase of the HAD superfamily